MQNIVSKIIMRGGEHKCRVRKMCLKLRDQQLKISVKKYTLLYKSFMITTKSKKCIHTQKGTKHNTKDSHQIHKSRAQNKKRPNRKKKTKTINKIAIGTHISVITS